MTIYDSLGQPELVNALQNYSIGVIPTDTIYGLVGKALHIPSVEKIYEIKGRKPEKPCIILINSIDDLESFLIDLPSNTLKMLSQIWPAPVSIIVPCEHKAFEYLHRGTNSLAFRMPDNNELLTLIDSVGPLIAPSANPEGMDPADSIVRAQEYFGEKVDFYVEGGVLEGEASTLVSFLNSTPQVLRQGVYNASGLVK